MVEFTRILCAIDFSDTSLLALAHAAAFARRYEAELIVAHVMPSVADMFAWTPDIANQNPQLSSERMQAMLRQTVASSPAAALDPRLVLKQGYTDEVLVDEVRTSSVDLLVLGTHGRRGFSRLFLGSIAEKLIRSAPCPVLTVPPEAAAAAAGPARFARILCPADTSSSAAKALAYAMDLGRAGGGRVIALRVLEYVDPDDERVRHDAALRDQREQLMAGARAGLHAWLPQDADTWCEIDELVVMHAGRASHAILDCARDARADLIVMGAQGSGGIELMLYGSNTHQVVRAARCPVLTVRG